MGSSSSAPQNAQIMQALQQWGMPQGFQPQGRPQGFPVQTPRMQPGMQPGMPQKPPMQPHPSVAVGPRMTAPAPMVSDTFRPPMPTQPPISTSSTASTPRPAVMMSSAASRSLNR